jgi:hypothetical protein
VKAAPDAGITAPASSVHPDSARARAGRASAAAIAAAQPAPRVGTPARNVKVAAAAPAISANVVAAARPVGATMRCKDGTYLTGAVSADRCASNGGVAVTFPVVAAPAPPRPQAQKRP